MYLPIEELGAVIYGYQMDQITEGDDNLIAQAVAAAIEEVGGYVGGTSLYDVPAIFAAEGEDRNPLILRMTQTVAKWHLVELCNADIIYDQAKERYDRAIAWLKQLANGTVTLGSLPLLSIEDEGSETENFGYGSRLKFNHDI